MVSNALSLCLWLQEKVLLWLLQFMQEQAISLDEIDQNGNTAVHVAAQYGHLTCIQVCALGKQHIFPLFPLSPLRKPPPSLPLCTSRKLRHAQPEARWELIYDLKPRCNLIISIFNINIRRCRILLFLA